MRLDGVRDTNLLTIVIPTAGRVTLKRCLDSITPMNQGGYGIDVVVAVDTHSGRNLGVVERLCEEYFVDYIEVDRPYSDWGYPQMEYIYKNRDENGLYIMNIGDDDIMVHGIIPKMWEILKDAPLLPHMFQAELFPSPNRGIEEGAFDIIWNDRERTVVRGAVTGQNLVVPNIPHLMGNMIDDFEFIRQTLDKWGHSIWVPLVTCQCY